MDIDLRKKFKYGHEIMNCKKNYHWLKPKKTLYRTGDLNLWKP